MVRGFEMVDIYSACLEHFLGIKRLAERDSVLQDNMIDEEKAKAEEAAQVSVFLCCLNGKIKMINAQWQRSPSSKGN